MTDAPDSDFSGFDVPDLGLAAALHRLAAHAPIERPDRIAAVIAGARRRERLRMATSVSLAAAVLVSVGLGLRFWQPTGQNAPDRYGVSVTVGGSSSPAGQSALASTAPSSPSAAISSPAPLSSPAGISSPAGALSLAPSQSASDGLSATVSTPAKASNYVPAQIEVKVVNHGTATVDGGSVLIVAGFADPLPGTGGNGIEYNGYSSNCQSSSRGTLCVVGQLRPGQSRVFEASVIPTNVAVLSFDTTWTHSRPTGQTVSTPFDRSIPVDPALPASMQPSPPSSDVPSSPAPG